MFDRKHQATNPPFVTYGIAPRQSATEPTPASGNVFVSSKGLATVTGVTSLALMVFIVSSTEVGFADWGEALAGAPAAQVPPTHSLPRSTELERNDVSLVETSRSPVAASMIKEGTDKLAAQFDQDSRPSAAEVSPSSPAKALLGSDKGARLAAAKVTAFSGSAKQEAKPSRQALAISETVAEHLPGTRSHNQGAIAGAAPDAGLAIASKPEVRAGIGKPIDEGFNEFEPRVIVLAAQEPAVELAPMAQLAVEIPLPDFSGTIAGSELAIAKLSSPEFEQKRDGTPLSDGQMFVPQLRVADSRSPVPAAKAEPPAPFVNELRQTRRFAGAAVPTASKNDIGSGGPSLDLSAQNSFAESSEPRGSTEMVQASAIAGGASGSLAVEISEGQLVSVKLDELISLFENQMERPLFVWLKSSSAASKFVTVQTLADAGIRSTYDPETAQLVLSAE